MKKIILILLFFSFISNEKGLAQSIDMGNYYLIAQSPLSAKQQSEIESIAKNFNIALQTDLTVKGYTTLNDTSLRRYTTELYGHPVTFNAAAGQVIFMRVLFDDTERLSIISYICEVTNESGRLAIDPLRAHTSSGHLSLWYDADEKAESLQATTKGLLKTPSESFADETFLTRFKGTPADDTLTIPQTPQLTTTNTQ